MSEAGLLKTSDDFVGAGEVDDTGSEVVSAADDTVAAKVDESDGLGVAGLEAD